MRLLYSLSPHKDLAKMVINASAISRKNELMAMLCITHGKEDVWK